MSYLKYFFFFGLFALGFHANSSAQTDIKKEVEVVKPYEPVVSDAKKITLLPVINDSVAVKPIFQYKVVPVAINTDYQLSTINAAKMLSMPLQKLYKGYLKLGYGNYNAPLAELYLNTLRSKKYAAGGYIRHNSSRGTVTLDNKLSAFAGYSDTKAELFGKKFLDNAIISAQSELQGNTVYRYGYQSDFPLFLSKDTIRQHYFLVGIKAGIQSTHTDSSKLFYSGAIRFNYFKDRYENGERNFNLAMHLNKKYDNKMLGLDIDYDLLNRNLNLDSTGNKNSIFNLTPWIGFATEDYTIKAGLILSFERQLDAMLLKPYPKAEFTFVVVKDVLIPFLGIYGKVQNHSYRDLTTENPFISPGLTAYNTFNDISFYGGVKGTLGSKATYTAKIEYSKLTDQYFFVNDTLVRFRNQFGIVYDNVKQTTAGVDVNYVFSDELSFDARFNLYQYELDHEVHAWHKPNYDLAIAAHYNMRNKILLNFDILGVGKRYAKEYSLTKPYKDFTSIVLKGAVDLNLGLEYRYTKVLSMWLKLNNFTATRYYAWNYYPSQRFNMMLGITYAL